MKAKSVTTMFRRTKKGYYYSIAAKYPNGKNTVVKTLEFDNEPDAWKQAKMMVDILKRMEDE